jgi:hypothetical protein
MPVEATACTKALTEALKTVLFGLRKGGKHTVRFDFAPGRIALEGPGAGSEIDAECQTIGSIVLAAEGLKDWARVPPLTPTVVLRLDGDRFRMGSTSYEVIVRMDIAPKAASIPINATAGDILRAVERDGEPAVLATVGRPAMDQARKELAEAVETAHRSLGKFGVRPAEIEAFIMTALRRGTRSG